MFHSGLQNLLPPHPNAAPSLQFVQDGPEKNSMYQHYPYAFTRLLCTVVLTLVVFCAGWVEYGYGTSFQDARISKTGVIYRVYKTIGPHNTQLSVPPGSIVVSLQDSTIHWVDDSGIYHSWEGNSGRNAHWGDGVLWWNGKLLRWAPPSTRSRGKGNPKLSSMDAKAIVEAVMAPVSLQTQVKRGIPDYTSHSG